jgi:hypothetical protein
MKRVLLLATLCFALVMPAGVWFPCPKPLSGHLESSLGLHFWQDHFFLRNLQVRGLFYLCNGIRINYVLRGNREINQIELKKNRKPLYEALNPVIDEGYLEMMGFFSHSGLLLSSSLRTGKIRYLRFPCYGLSARMDQVPGMADIRNDYEASGYEGFLLVNDLIWNNLFGWHSTLFAQNYGLDQIAALENYAFVTYDYSWFQAELRGGWLVKRNHDSDKVPLDSDFGYSLMAGLCLHGYDLNLYWEKVADIIYTGLSIRFASSPFTRFAGKVRLDYNRACEGLVMQYPVFYTDLNLATASPAGKIKVGEIVAERSITFWRIGMQRNFYEHIISQNGITNPRETEVVITKKPMLLGIESIVSPVYKFRQLSDIRQWDSAGIRPGQLTRKVVYEFYQ